MSGSPPYAELHCHSAYSFLDGASSPEDLAETAVELGYQALALTDHDGVWGSMEFAQECKRLDLKAITGTELSVILPPEPGPGRDGGPSELGHLTLLAEDRRGYSNLCRLITAAHASTRESPGRDRTPPGVALELVLERSAGLICLTGCARDGLLAGRWARQNPRRGEWFARLLLDAFGPDCLRIELQRPYWRHDRARNRWLSGLARRLGVPTVATGNVHSHDRRQARLQDAFVAVRRSASLEASEPWRRGNWSSALARPEAMADRFRDHPEAVAESTVLAERVRFDLTADLGYTYPGAEDGEADRKLARLCGERLRERYPRPPDSGQARSRLDEELAVISHLGLSGFFLLHHDLLELAREVAAEVRGGSAARAVLPPGRGRGSSVSSLVCYLTGLSHIDPLHANLRPARFLNYEVQAPPDIDLDFPRDIREKLIPRIHERYGRDRCALVAAFPTYRARGAIRELGRALGLPPGEIERVARNSHIYGDVEEVQRDVAAAIGADRACTPRWRHLIQLSRLARGLPRHASQHSGGMVISTRPLIDLCPIVPAAMEGRQIVQWEKDSCNDARFVKIDLLGLGMLSGIERCVDEIERARGELIDLSRIPLDDGPTYDSICRGDTTGVFQIESRAQMQLLVQTEPRSIEDLTVQVALVRPGPIQGGAVHPYVERHRRRRSDPTYRVPYAHPALEPVLKETFGTIIYQDQVIEVARALAGFSIGQGESLRRALSRRRSEKAIERHRVDFIKGAAARGVSEQAAELIFQQIQGFAGFGFPKSHSAAFGLLAYQSAWLRQHYGPEYLAALLNEQPMGFYPPDALIHEAQLRGIEVLAPDVSHSARLCRVKEGSVQLGLSYVKGLDRAVAEELVKERERHGPYTDLADLASRSGAPRHQLEILAWAGALRSLAPEPEPRSQTPDSPAPPQNRRDSLWRIGLSAASRRLEQGTQLSLPLTTPEAPSLPALDSWQSVLAEYQTTSVSLEHHPMQLQRRLLPYGVLHSRQVPQASAGETIDVAGLVIARQRPETANGIVFILLEDEHGTLNLIVMPRERERYRSTVNTAPMLLARGKLEFRNSNHNLIAGQLLPLGGPDLSSATPAIQNFGRRGR